MATVKKTTAKAASPAKKAVAVSAVKKVTAAKPAPASASKSGSKTPAGKAAAAAKTVAIKPAAKAPAAAVTKKTVAKSPVEKVAAPAKVAAKTSVAKPVAAKATPAKPVPKKPALAKTVAPTKPTVAPAVQKKAMPEKVTKPLTVAAAPAKTAPAPKSAGKASTAKKKKAVIGVPGEDEIVQMTDDEYMNEAQLAFFKMRLQTMKDEILVNARETGEHLKENEVFADPNDRATVEEENMLEQRVRDRERKLLKKIDQSLARIEAGDYGYCLETGEPIGIPRLLARPTAELCIEAQEKHERREKLFAD